MLPSEPWDGNFRYFPPTLRPEHIAYLCGYTINTVRKMAQQRNDKIPTPCMIRPFGGGERTCGAFTGRDSRD